ncbi:TniB family NTP-binding protein [Cupriavidus sp. H18C2]|uniref:TniB family NTP-binding protein n=1 Tax=Cupriavidus sp. H18C2 TaxID=3241602 RepID=UPI003BF86256
MSGSCREGLLDFPAPTSADQSVSPADARQRALNGSPEDRETFTAKVVVKTPYIQMMDDSVRSLMDVACRVPFPGGFCVAGEGGTGKTVLLEDIKKKFPPSESYFSSTKPVVEIRLPERPTPAGLAQQLLHELGNPLANVKVGPNIDAVLFRTLSVCRTKIVLFDEAHHLMPSSGPRRNSARLTGATGDYLKFAHDMTRIPFGFFGPPEFLDAFNTDSQLRSRFPGRIEMTHYVRGPDWVQVLSALDRALPLPELGGLASPEMALWLHKASSGNFRELKRLLGRAVFLASTERSHKLSKKYLEQASRLINMGRGVPS